MAQDQAAFALKDSYGDLSGGSIAVGPEGRTLDVVGLLEEGKGTIVTDVPEEIQALDQYEAVKRVSVPKRVLREQEKEQKLAQDAETTQGGKDS